MELFFGIQAQVTAAVRMQDKQADRRTESARLRVGLDVARIEKDMTDNEVKAATEENFKLGPRRSASSRRRPQYAEGKDYSGPLRAGKVLRPKAPLVPAVRRAGS